MGFGDAYFNVVLLHQKFYSTPFWIDKVSGKVGANPILKTRWKMFGWYYSLTCVCLMWITCVVFLFMLIQRNKRHDTVKPVEVIALLFALLGATQSLVTVYTMETFPDDRTFIIDQNFKVAGIYYRGWPNSKRIPDFPELIGYGIGFGFWNFAFITLVAPWMKPIGPVHSLLAAVGGIPFVVQNVAASAFYGTMGVYAANSCASVILWVTASCHGFENETRCNYLLSIQVEIKETPNQLEKLKDLVWVKVMIALESILKIRVYQKEEEVAAEVNKENKFCRDVSQRFEQRRKKHVQLYLLVKVSNETMVVYMPVLIAVGMALCVAGNYVCLTMYKREDLRIVFFGGIFIVILIHGLIIFLCIHAAFPGEYFEKTIRYWRGQKLGALQRKQVQAMFVSGFSFAGYMKITKSTAIDLVDDILNHTVTVLLA